MSPKKNTHSKEAKMPIERIQTGIRLEKRLVKVLKGLAEQKDLTLGEIIELISLHALEREHAFTADALPTVKKMKEIYGMDYDVHAYEKFVEQGS